MKIANRINETRQQVKEWKREGFSVGLVPTMGYLHEGHKSLIDRAIRENDKVVVSIFINPIQFGTGEDLDSYPQDMKNDIALCEEVGVSLVFNPDSDEMYEEGFSSFVDMTTLTACLCGKKRENHFRGVCTVVSKLFNIISPDRAYFGQKDAQQLAVIKHMVNDLNFDIEIVGCDTVREADGLAKSSRNSYLSSKERKAATVLNQSLEMGREMIEAGERNADKIIEKISSNIKEEPLAKIDYVEIVDYNTLEKVSLIDNSILIAIAVYIGETRLIDNIVVR